MSVRKRNTSNDNEYFEIKKRKCDYPTLQSDKFYHDLLNLGKLFKLSRQNINDMSDEVDFSYIFNTIKWSSYSEKDKANIIEYINTGKCYILFEKVLKALNITDSQMSNDKYEIYTFVDMYVDYLEPNKIDDLCTCLNNMSLNK